MMFVCEFNPARRSHTQHYVLHPCHLTLHAATPESTGMHISLTASDIRLNISPGTIELLSKAMTTFTCSSTNSQANNSSCERIDYTDLWSARSFVEREYWFIKIDGAEEALSTMFDQPRSITYSDPLPEVCIVDMPSIVIVMETGFGYYTYPMLNLKSRLSAEIENWSSEVSIFLFITI